jgi:heptosyltransferase-2
MRAELASLAAGALEAHVRSRARRVPALSAPPNPPRSIFVLRNNDVGDVLVATPLLAALRNQFPDATIVAGVGHWSVDVLRHNPHLSEVAVVDAPWANKYVQGQSLRGRFAYLRASPQLAPLAAKRFDVGIDVLGSAWGALLLLRLGIPYRIGVRGYAGGHAAAQATVDFDPGEHVAQTGLRLAERLGAVVLPEPRPQIFLAHEELRHAESWWQAAPAAGDARRVVVAPGGGLPLKRWPADRFAQVTRNIAAQGNAVTVLSGLGEDEAAAEIAGGFARVVVPDLRQTFGIISTADLVICNSSMAMHVAAAFAKPAVVVLGPAFASAAAHQAQWGYRGLSRSLGREPGHTDLTTADEATATARELLARPAA